MRSVGSLENVAADRKAIVVGWLIERVTELGENPQAWWAVGRLGARVPFYGSAYNVVPQATATAWVERCLAQDWRASEHAAFAAALLCRVSGDRGRDLDPELRLKVASRLETVGAPPSWRAHHRGSRPCARDRLWTRIRGEEPAAYGAVRRGLSRRIAAARGCE